MKENKVQLAMYSKLGFHLGIDATNIRGGGGLTHLSQLLQAGDPMAAGISRVTVWACQSTISTLPERPWLFKRNLSWMEAALPRRMIGQQFQLMQEFRNEGCDVLFSPGGTLSSWRSMPAVTMSQNMLPFEPIEAALFGGLSAMRLKMRLLRHTQGRSFRGADGIIFLTEYAKIAISKALVNLPGKMALIPHGIEQRFFQMPRLQRSIAECIESNPFRMLYVSILMPYKHQMQVARAVFQLRTQGIPIEMRFIGASWGSYGKQFRALLDELDPKHEFLLWSGAESFDVLHDFYRNTDAFIFASSCENLPNILIEAMAAGLPIASSNRGPMPEVLGDAGVYFDPGSISSIVEVLRTLVYDKSLRDKLANFAWNKAHDYSWERCANETFRFIVRVVQLHNKENREFIDV